MSNEFQGIEVFGPQPRPQTRRARRAQRAPAPSALRRARLGLFALGAGIATVIATSVGIGLSMAQQFAAGILLAYLATGISVVAVLCGAAAVVTQRGRRWGAIGIVLGVLASPPVLTRLLSWASGLG
jgi:hypothetical protein